MVRIAQNNLRLYIIKKFALVHAFYRCLRADRHKDRRLNHAVIRGNMPNTRGRVGVGVLKRKEARRTFICYQLAHASLQIQIGWRYQLYPATRRY